MRHGTLIDLHAEGGVGYLASFNSRCLPYWWHEFYSSRSSSREKRRSGRTSQAAIQVSEAHRMSRHVYPYRYGDIYCGSPCLLRINLRNRTSHTSLHTLYNNPMQGCRYSDNHHQNTPRCPGWRRSRMTKSESERTE